MTMFFRITNNRYNILHVCNNNSYRWYIPYGTPHANTCSSLLHAYGNFNYVWYFPSSLLLSVPYIKCTPPIIVRLRPHAPPTVGSVILYNMSNPLCHETTRATIAYSGSWLQLAAQLPYMPTTISWPTQVKTAIHATFQSGLLSQIHVWQVEREETRSEYVILNPWKLDMHKEYE